MYSNVYGWVRGVGAAGRNGRLPLPPPLALPYTGVYICEHFMNFVRELLVNIASVHSVHVQQRFMYKSASNPSSLILLTNLYPPL
jgi:hypothetical protein